jgi:Flp pilus assembly protein TadD
MGRMPDAERAYKATVEVDPKSGEAHNNLAVVYLTTGRIEDAERAVQAAEKAGFKVNQGLKDDIRAAKQKTND